MAGASVLRGRVLLLFVGFLWLAAVLWPTGRGAAQAQADPHRPAGPVAFQPGAECMACHNGLITPSGEHVSIGASWRASMMAHSSRDPYWQGTVRREANAMHEDLLSQRTALIDGATHLGLKPQNGR